MRLAVLSALIACASAAQVEVTVFSHCSSDFQGAITVGGQGTYVTIPAGGQATFFIPDASHELIVNPVGQTQGSLIDFFAAEGSNGSQGDLFVNAPSLAPGVVLTPSGTLGGSCQIVDAGTSYSAKPAVICPSGTFYAIDICQS